MPHNREDRIDRVALAIPNYSRFVWEYKAGKVFSELVRLWVGNDYAKQEMVFSHIRPLFQYHLPFFRKGRTVNLLN